MRSQTDKMIAGVCGGIAVYLNIDSVLVRFAFVMLLFASGIGLPLYIILLILMPVDDSQGIHINPGNPDLDEEIKVYDEDIANTKSNNASSGTTNQGPIIFAAILILIGLYLLAQNVSFLAFLNIGWFGPLLIIGIGLYVIYRGRK